jgi:hypothetical protein
MRRDLRRNFRRNFGWLAGLSLALACSVNSSNLDLDASVCLTCVGTGGASASGGPTGAGGVTATGGAPATGGQVGTGGDGQSGGTIGTGGNGQSGGATGAGGGQSGGATGTGGDGQSGGNNGKGGNNGNGGNNGKGGQGGAESCDTLATDYANAMTAAKKCTVGAPNQCQQLVNDTIGCSGCREYVNDATTLNAIETQWANQGCASGHLCSTIACVTPPTSCVAATTGGPGSGAGMCESNLVGTAGH